MSALQARGVALRRGGTVLLDAIDLTVPRGEIVGLIGANGAGKTSLLRILGGLDTGDSGEVRLGDVLLKHISPRERGRHIAYLPQDSTRLPPLAVQDLVELGRLPWRGATRPHVDNADRWAIDRAIELTGLEPLRARDAATLSGGEAARVRMARALATQAPYLLADEPVAALDPGQALRLMQMFRRLAQSGMGICVVLHDLTLASRFCDRLLLLADGKALASGLPDHVLTDANLANAYGVKVRRIEDAVIPWLPNGG